MKKQAQTRLLSLTLVGVVILMMAFALLVAAQPRPPEEREMEYGSGWDKSCDNGICNVNIYSYEKYWNNGESWEEVDENWFACGESYCTRNYYLNVTADSSGMVSTRTDSREWNIRLENFRGQNLQFSPILNGSVLIYQDVAPGVDLQYQYLPKKVKEEIVIKDRPNISQDNFNISFTKSGSGTFDVPASIICDAEYDCQEIRHWINENEILVEIPADFLLDESTEYPVVVDPTIELNDSFIAWNGYVTFANGTLSPYMRTNNPTSISLTNLKRGAIDWNISSVPDNSEIDSAVVGVYSSVASTPYNVSVVQMEGSSFDYDTGDEECQGNCHFYDDMGNGTVYDKSVNTVLKNAFINYTLPAQGLSDLENSLGSDIFSVGLFGEYFGTIVVVARDYPTASLRPKLTITYTEYSIPNINFVSPTPSNGSSQENTNIYVNLSSSDTGEHYSFTDFDSDLSLFMSFDELDSSGNPVDMSSYSNNGSLEGDSTISSGRFGDGLILDGSGDYAEINGSSSLRLELPVTIAAWVNVDSLSDHQPIFTNDYTPDLYYGIWTYVSSSGKFVANVGDGGAPGSSSRRTKTGTSTLSTGQWYHLTAVIRSPTDMSLFVNGVADSGSYSGTGDGLNYTSTGTTVIGSRDFSDSAPPLYLDGNIDEVLVFNRSLLSTEILSIYNATSKQYEHNFTSLSDGEHSFKGYAVNGDGKTNSTEIRTVTIGTIANETEGDDAIEEGIDNAISSNPIESDQQVYVVDLTGTHSQGYFDKATLLGNQTWAFNYITSGESFTNMSSLFDVFNVWEEETLSYQEIVDQVETFINNLL